MPVALTGPCCPLETLDVVTLRYLSDSAESDGYGGPVQQRLDVELALLAPNGAQQVDHDLDRGDRTRISNEWKFWIANTEAGVHRPKAGDTLVFAGCTFKVDGVMIRTAPCCGEKLTVHHYEVTATETTG